VQDLSFLETQTPFRNQPANVVPQISLSIMKGIWSKTKPWNGSIAEKAQAHSRRSAAPPTNVCLEIAPDPLCCTEMRIAKPRLRNRRHCVALLVVVMCGLPSFGQMNSDANTRGTISGMVVDPNGNFLNSAVVRLTRIGQPQGLQVTTDQEGHFLITDIQPGPFALTIAASGFSAREVAGSIDPGQVLALPEIALSIATATTEVQVRVTTYELAEEQIKAQEQQRVLGFIPNFYVTYEPGALPLRPRQKFELAWKTSLDPVTIAASLVIAGIEQSSNSFKGYGQGAQGFAKRFGASYADASIGNLIGGALLPVVFKQDPRYFYKGTGSARSRILYALANAVMSKGDNGHWQPAYAGILGSLASGGISNLYYPASSRNGAVLTFQNTLVGVGGSAVGNLFQEFLVRKLTPHAHGRP
jgi:Carboxypeptidase regulatory-like domain